MTYKFQLLHKPTISAWPSIARLIKITIYTVVLVAILWLSYVIVSWTREYQRNVRVERLYEIQSSKVNVLNMELRYIPQVNEKDDVWRAPSIHHTHIFSAYLDTRPEIVLDEKPDALNEGITWAMVRIIGIIPVDSADLPLICYYKYKHPGNDGETFVEERSAIGTRPIAFGENFGLRYITAFILCELTLSEYGHRSNVNLYRRHLPIEITVSSISRNHSELRDDEFVPIHYPKETFFENRDPKHFMAVCVPTFHHNYGKVLNLIEFVEFYRMMGAGRFTFYNESTTREVSQVLKYYEENEVATILQWQLPSYYVFEKTIRVRGIFAALNDCLYRSSFYAGYKYVAGVDVDEFIVPRKHKDYKEMMSQLDPWTESTSNERAVFIFRNAFFYLMLEDDPVTLGPEIPVLYLQSKTSRWTEINAPHDRSKYIARGQDTVELGNHMAWDTKKIRRAYNKKFKEFAVDPEVAASQHYRYCETNAESCWLRSMVTDTVAHRFTEELGNRVAETCNKIFKNGCPANEDSKPYVENPGSKETPRESSLRSTIRQS